MSSTEYNHLVGCSSKNPGREIVENLCRMRKRSNMLCVCLSAVASIGSTAVLFCVFRERIMVADVVDVQHRGQDGTAGYVQTCDDSSFSPRLIPAC